jgi:DNA-directed RNA polymerase subunit RPC12/RpoP
MRISYEFTRQERILFWFEVSVFIASTFVFALSLVMLIRGETDRTGDCIQFAALMSMFLFFIAQLLANAKRLPRASTLSAGAHQNGRHCPHCGSAVALLAVATIGRKITCQYCGSRIEYKEAPPLVRWIAGGVAFALPIIFVLFSWSKPIWPTKDIVGIYGVLLCLMLGGWAGLLLKALYLRAKRELVLISPPPAE